MKVTEEPKELLDEFGMYERCVFCNIPTTTWHVRTNNPVCYLCSKTHKVSELKNHRK